MLGAGASFPYGLPTGPRLMELILEGCRREPNNVLRASLRDAGASNADVANLAEALSLTQFDSIDVLLEHQPELRAVGKLAIAASLIPYERPEQLLRPDTSGQHWYRLLFNRLIGPNGFDASLLSIVTLNYDRSLEEYLYTTLIRDLRLSHEDAARTVANIEFVHVHGQLGELPWRPARRNAGQFSRAYSPDLDADRVRGSAEGILIVSEFNAGENVEFLHHLHRLFNEAEVVGFLGFGYHETVMERLGAAQWARPGTGGNDARQIFGSAFGLPHGRQLELLRDVHRFQIGDNHHHVHEFLQQSQLIYQGRPEGRS